MTTNDAMPLWKSTWRKGVAPLLSTAHLESLRLALVNDDARLIQKATTLPPALSCVADWNCEGACPLAYPFAVEHGGLGEQTEEGKATLDQVEEAFGKACFAADQLLGEPAAIRWFLNWIDDTPRDEMRRELLIEVQRSLAARLEDEAAAEATQQQ